jgi:hypothetical protein
MLTSQENLVVGITLKSSTHIPCSKTNLLRLPGDRPTITRRLFSETLLLFIDLPVKAPVLGSKGPVRCLRRHRKNWVLSTK